MARSLDQLVAETLGQQQLAILRLQAELERKEDEAKALRDELVIAKAGRVESSG